METQEHGLRWRHPVGPVWAFHGPAPREQTGAIAPAHPCTRQVRCPAAANARACHRAAPSRLQPVQAFRAQLETADPSPAVGCPGPPAWGQDRARCNFAASANGLRSCWRSHQRQFAAAPMRSAASVQTGGRLLETSLERSSPGTRRLSSWSSDRSDRDALHQLHEWHANSQPAPCGHPDSVFLGRGSHGVCSPSNIAQRVAVVVDSGTTLGGLWVIGGAPPDQAVL